MKPEYSTICANVAHAEAQLVESFRATVCKALVSYGYQMFFERPDADYSLELTRLMIEAKEKIALRIREEARAGQIKEA